MKMKITIKHITLALGILVALVAAMMFFAGESSTLESTQAVRLPVFSLPKVVPAAIKMLEIFF
jgi:hypothetical protein